MRDRTEMTNSISKRWQPGGDKHEALLQDLMDERMYDALYEQDDDQNESDGGMYR